MDIEKVLESGREIGMSSKETEDMIIRECVEKLSEGSTASAEALENLTGIRIPAESVADAYVKNVMSICNNINKVHDYAEEEFSQLQNRIKSFQNYFWDRIDETTKESTYSLAKELFQPNLERVTDPYDKRLNELKESLGVEPNNKSMQSIYDVVVVPKNYCQSSQWIYILERLIKASGIQVSDEIAQKGYLALAKSNDLINLDRLKDVTGQPIGADSYRIIIRHMKDNQGN